MTTQEFIITLFEIEVTAHIAHWQTRSFAEHKALGELYEEIPSLRDSFTELYQGATEKILSSYPQPKISEGLDMKNYLKGKVEDFRTFRLTIKQTEIQQKIDDIIDFLNSIIYKLKFLS